MKKSTTTPESLAQPILDLIHDLDELESVIVRQVQDIDKLSTKMKDENFVIQEAVREEVLKFAHSVNALLTGLDNRMLDNSLAQMPNEVSQNRAQILISAKRAEFRASLVEQRIDNA